ncbi:MAG: site-specific integrase [Rubrobacteraceae bacterium]|nr:site-specific integrase [Rubrobacteraceae bacterium]
MARKFRKNGNGEGSVFQRKDGYWVAQYAVTSHGTTKYRQSYGKTQKEAIQKRNEARIRENSGLVFEAGRTTVGEYLDRWLKESVKDSVKPNTYDSYSHLIRRHVIPAFRRTKLKNLTTDQIRTFRRCKLDEGLSTRTVQYLLFLLRKALQQAVEDGLIPRNVAHGVKVSQAGEEEVRPFSPEQTNTFLEAVSGDRFEALYVLAVHTGLRQGELMGLCWEDVDLKARTLSVKRTLSGAKGGQPVFGTPKTAKSRRTVGLTGKAVETLEGHRVAQEEERSRLGPLWHNTGLVFRSTTSTPLNRHNVINRSFKPLLKRSGLPQSTRFHDLRHTAASLLFSQGTHPKLVQETLGHSSIAVTLDVYSHMIPGMGDKVVKAMEDALS